MDSPKTEEDKLASTQENAATTEASPGPPTLARDTMPDEDEVVKADDNASVTDSGFGADNS